MSRRERLVFYAGCFLAGLVFALLGARAFS